MNPEDAVDLGREALKACLMVGGPVICIGLLAGLAMGVLQAMTQIQDQTVSFVPKLLVMLLAIGITLPWLSDKMVDYTREALQTPSLQLGTSSPVFERPSWSLPGSAPVESESGLPAREDRIARQPNANPTTRMPTLEQRYSMPTFVPDKSTSMPVLGRRSRQTEQDAPRVADVDEPTF